MASPNKLYYGDNLDVLRRHMKDESVDLVYLDPPFKSGRDYNVLFEEHDGSKAQAQIQAFEDTWDWDPEARAMYDSVIMAGGKVSETLQAFKTILGGSPMLAYLTMMAPRLVELRRVLKDTGSIYLHCDSTASAHLRILMDAVFGTKNFRNEIVWYYYNKMHDKRKRLFPRATDNILFYVKNVNSSFHFKQLKEAREAPVRQLARKKVAGKMVNLRGADGKVVYRESTERTLDNVWRIPCLQPADKTQNMGYPTQKPEGVLERIIEASTAENAVILDPFCGCGTSIAVAQKMHRRWIGIDITHLAIGLIKSRLLQRHSIRAGVDYEVVGEPTDLTGATQLASEDRHQFEHWALGLVGARASAKGKGSDRGVDGVLMFDDGQNTGSPKKVLISVKSGAIKSGDVRDLRGVVQRDNGAIGLLITLRQPTREMIREAAESPAYTTPWGQHRSIQIMTVEQLLSGSRIDMPPIQPGGTTLPSLKKAEAQQKRLI
jgi:site-specific DNA-methyltransferase (adenine-specific)